jgi:methylated-DNA-[protein]-cysteine S-methyltransferase
MSAAGFALFETALGVCAIAWRADAIAGVLLPEETGAAATRLRMQRDFPRAAQLPPPGWVSTVIERLQQLLEQGGQDTLEDVPLDLSGVPQFQRRVYAIARTIAPGQTLTYGEVAARLGEPGAARAVGQALGANPFAPIVPCHRVLAAGGRAGGFSAGGGVVTKLRMLETEKAQFGDGPGLFD